MNRQLSALTDDQLAAFDGGDDLAPDVPTQEPTPEMYAAALSRLKTRREATFDGGDDWHDLRVQLVDGAVIVDQCGAFLWLSPDMLRAAADWVAQQ